MIYNETSGENLNEERKIHSFEERGKLLSGEEKEKVKPSPKRPKKYLTLRKSFGLWSFFQ